MRTVLLVVVLVVAASTAAPAGAAVPAAGAAPATVRVSVTGSGEQADGDSYLGGNPADTAEPGFAAPAMSADGRYIAFTSHAANLVPGDTNNATDAFVRDTVAGTTTRVNVASTGAQDDSQLGALDVSISADGRYAAFTSEATDLAPEAAGAPAWAAKVFVHDLWTGTTVDASVDSGDVPADSSSYDPVLSSDGRYVAFSTAASNFSGAQHGALDVYVRDLVAGTTTLASVSTDGVPAGPFEAQSAIVSGISADGRFVAFTSGATNLVPGDTNGVEDVFVRDMSAGTLQRVSLASTGAQGDGNSMGGSLSADGTKIAFTSDASNLVPGDTNGVRDVFFRDLVSGTTWLVSRSTGGSEGNKMSQDAMLSADGRHVAFTSYASNLVHGDRNRALDMFVRDLGRRRTNRVDIADDGGAEAGLGCVQGHVSISAHGRRVAFDSADPDLVAGDTNAAEDVFERVRR